MKRLFLIGLMLCGCAGPRKPCQVERICQTYRAEVLENLTNHPAMMMDVLKTIATLEEEAGGYR